MQILRNLYRKQRLSSCSCSCLVALLVLRTSSYVHTGKDKTQRLLLQDLWRGIFHPPEFGVVSASAIPTSGPTQYSPREYSSCQFFAGRLARGCRIGIRFCCELGVHDRCCRSRVVFFGCTLHFAEENRATAGGDVKYCRHFAPSHPKYRTIAGEHMVIVYLCKVCGWLSTRKCHTSRSVTVGNGVT